METNTINLISLIDHIYIEAMSHVFKQKKIKQLTILMQIKFIQN